MSILSILRSWLYGPPLREVPPPADTEPRFVDKPDDVYIWPCGTWCHAYELAERGLPGNCQILRAGSHDWLIFLRTDDQWTQP